MGESARSIFERFRALPRSEQIATAFALDGIMRWAKRRPKGRALDYGYGLGTVSEAIRAVDVGRHQTVAERRPEFSEYATLFEHETTVEDDGDPGPPYASTTFVTSMARAINYGPYALVVIDDAADTYDLGTLAMQGLASRAVIIFEGNRPCERGALTAMLAHVGRPHVVATWKPKDRSKGFSVALCDPTFTERVWFFAVRQREGLLDTIARWRGIRPGFRRRDSDHTA